MADLIVTQPSAQSDWLCIEEDWYNYDVATILPGQSFNCPASSMMPPVYGPGRGRVESFLQGCLTEEPGAEIDSNYPPVYAGIGVSNPSEVNYPMNPYTGVQYPSVWTIFYGGFHFKRLDMIEDSPVAPISRRSYTMNPGNTAADGRKNWPSLCASITNNTARMITVVQISFRASLVH
jgi:hypothetical protein